jgi:hypothetical protein
MRHTFFEGVPAKVPFAYDQVLREEYSEKAMITTEFHK